MKTNKFRRFDRVLLPNIVDYYRQQFPSLRIKPEWTAVCCPFHQDHKPSLSINLVSGGFHCFSCSARGGDIIAFHMRRYQMTFLETVSFFEAWCYD
jgi:DNA primase